MPLLPARARRAPAALLVPARGLLEARVPWARDRALDHAVERERHLVPFLLAKDALLAATPPPHAVPLHSLPSAIPFPFRPLRFLRLYPSAFALSPHPVEVSRRPGSPRCAPPRRRPATPRAPTPPTASCGCSC